MADVAGDLKTWSATAASNSPAGGTAVGTGLDDNLRELQKVVRQDLATKGSDIASATSTDIGAVAGLMHDITGTTTITGLGTVSAGIWKILKFEGALTLTHNATSLILPGGANITTADGDTGIFISEGSGNWRCVSYSRVSGRAPLQATLATEVATTSGTTVSVTTSIPAAANRILLHFNGVSLDGTDDILVQIGPSGGVETTGYVSEGGKLGASTGISSSTAGFIIRVATASEAVSGTMTINRYASGSSRWIATHNARTSTSFVSVGAGNKSITGDLARITLASSGTDEFDAGGVSVTYE